MRLFPLFVLLTLVPCVATAAEASSADSDDLYVLPPLQVSGERFEDLGFRVNGALELFSAKNTWARIAEVFPNTAASKAGLKPGEELVKIDGKPISILSLAFRPNKLQDRLWAELQRGKKSVSVLLELRDFKTSASRTLTLTIPSPPPHWGSEKWAPPEGRAPAVVPEPGPLAELARKVLDNGIWAVADWIWTRENDRDEKTPILGYSWRINQPEPIRGSNNIFVSQEFGRTQIEIFHRLPGGREYWFLTSPSGALETGYQWNARRDVPDEAVRAAFQDAIDYWTNRVSHTSSRWPFEPIAATLQSSALSPQPSAVTPALTDSFLKLPVATTSQQELFNDALSKIGSDESLWAYTETSPSLDDNKVTTVRYDSSKPEAGRAVLLKVDGKEPKAAYLAQWSKENHEPLPALGDLPPISSVVDTDNIRVVAEEFASIVFELPVKSTISEFPADKFQARFRVNKTTRGLEDFSVKLRESIGVKGVAKVTDAGLEARFQTLDPTLAPQPVYIKMGGGVRVLLVKISRTFEITRTDFQRVVPRETP